MSSRQWTVRLARNVISLLQRRLPRWPTDDVRRRSGDVLIDPEGLVRVHRVGVSSIDRPSVADILARL